VLLNEAFMILIPAGKIKEVLDKQLSEQDKLFTAYVVEEFAKKQTQNLDCELQNYGRRVEELIPSDVAVCLLIIDTLFSIALRKQVLIMTEQPNIFELLDVEYTDEDSVLIYNKLLDNGITFRLSLKEYKSSKDLLGYKSINKEGCRSLGIVGFNNLKDRVDLSVVNAKIMMLAAHFFKDILALCVRGFMESRPNLDRYSWIKEEHNDCMVMLSKEEYIAIFS
jgi:hypothetical protein